MKKLTKKENEIAIGSHCTCRHMYAGTGDYETRKDFPNIGSVSDCILQCCGDPEAVSGLTFYWCADGLPATIEVVKQCDRYIYDPTRPPWVCG